jgi:hypothetical protein
VTYDGLARAFLATATDPNGVGLVTSTTVYDGLGRAIRASSALATTAADTDSWVRTTYDDQNRVREVATYTGRVEPGTTLTGKITTEYLGQVVTVTDQAGKKRRSKSDALGRIVEVTEDPTGPLAATTTYRYDGRGNLRYVYQGVQTRTFVYDALGRLSAATMPECGPSTGPGTTTYQYDFGSNLTVVTDPRGIQTTNKYDEMDRLRSVDYFSNTAPGIDVSYFYDESGPSTAEAPGATLPPGFDPGRRMGRLVGVLTNAASETSQERTGVFYGYDLGGRVLRTTQLTVTNGNNVYDASSATYNAGSQPVSLTYPSGATVNMSHNAAGALSGVTRNAQTLASSLSYAPTGGLAGQTLGNGLVHTITYNGRSQPREIRLGSSPGAHDKLRLEYDYGVWTPSLGQAILEETQASNSGNVARIKITPDASASTVEQYFSYDQLNRLAMAREFVGTGGGGGATIPDPPSSLQATATSASQIALTWNDNSQDETGFKIERRQGSGQFEPVTTVAANITSFTNNGLQQDTLYTYRVRATNSAGDSAPSNEATARTGIGGAPLGAPTLLSAVPSNQRVTLTWTSVPNAINYKAYISSTPGGPYE